MAAVAEPLIRGQGTPASAWAAWAALQSLPGRSAADLLPADARAVVVAPHPDDELLAVGGLMQQWATMGRELQVIGVTDGEAGLPKGDTTPAAVLAQVRSDERARGLARLGLPATAIHRLGLPDGAATAHEADLQQALQAVLRPGDRVFTTWRHDGHPDHEATGRAVAAACRTTGALLHEVPVWTWHWAEPGDARVPWHRLQRVALPAAAQAAKRAALAEHASQLRAPEGEQPILPAWAIARWLRPWEYLLAPEQEPLQPEA